MKSRRSHCACGSRQGLWRTLQSNVGSVERLSELGIRKDALQSEVAWLPHVQQKAVDESDQTSISRLAIQQALG